MEMNLWTYVHLLCFVVYASAVFYVIVKNPYAVTNWILALIFGFFSLWSGCSTVLNNTGIDLKTAGIVMNIQSIGWASFASYYFLFILYLTNNKKLLSMPLLLVLLITIPIILINRNFSGEMLQCCTKVSYGIAGKWKNSGWSYAYFGYYAVIFFWSAFLLVRHRNSTAVKSEKQVVDILLGSTAAVFVLGTLNSVILNYAGLSIPTDVNVIFLIFVAAFVFCAEKYETFTLSSPRNADRIMELIDEGIVLLDSDGKMTTANRAAMEIFGFGCKYDTKNACLFIEEAVKNQMHEPGRKEITNLEIKFRDAAGMQKTALLSSRIVSRDNKNSGVVCSIRDITGKKKTEEDLMETVKELKRSNEELESFAYVASHDLKEPLRMVSSYVQLIRKKFSDKLGKDGNEFIAFASDGAKHMDALIGALLEYSRIRKSRADYTDVDTEEVFKRVFNTMQIRIKEINATVTAQGLPVLKADAMQMEQLFMNLISNALKFSGEAPLVLSVGAEKQDGNYMFVFKDNGIGIDMQYKEKMFQIFQRLHGREKYEGTGIGLAICRKIVETHNGRIWVESEGPGRGCSFYFTLPAVQTK